MGTTEQQGITVKYQDIGSFEFMNTMMKIASTPTASKNALAIRNVSRAIEKARVEMQSAYQKDIMEVYGQKNEDGTLKRPEGEPNSFLPLEDKIEELKKVQDEFGLRSITVATGPLRPGMLADMKLSARDLEALKEFFAEEDGPGVPTLTAIK